MRAHKKSIVHNFISLSLVQGLTILFPLITFPYLIRVLGVEGFGIFTLLQTGIMYADMLVAFGFGLTATKHISENLHEPAKTKQIIAAVYLIKFLLFISAVLLLVLAAVFLPFFRENSLLLLVCALYLLGNLLFPDWYFQGIQKMRYISFVVFVSKLVALLLIFIFVRSESDLIYVMASLAAGNLIAGLLGFVIMKRYAQPDYKLPDRHTVTLLFRESSLVFMSIILAPFYSSVNIFILQAFTNPLIVGYYAIADKIYGAISMLTSVANRSIYPHLTQLYSKSKAAYAGNVRKVLLLFFTCFTVFALGLFWGAEIIVKLVSGASDENSVTMPAKLLRIMSVAVFFSPYVSFFFQLLIIQGQRKTSVANIVAIVIINLAGACTLTHYYGVTGMAINVCIVVFLIAIFNAVSVNRKQALLPQKA